MTYTHVTFVTVGDRPFTMHIIEYLDSVLLPLGLTAEKTEKAFTDLTEGLPKIVAAVEQGKGVFGSMRIDAGGIDSIEIEYSHPHLFFGLMVSDLQVYRRIMLKDNLCHCMSLPIYECYQLRVADVLTISDKLDLSRPEEITWSFNEDETMLVARLGARADVDYFLNVASEAAIELSSSGNLSSDEIMLVELDVYFKLPDEISVPDSELSDWLNSYESYLQDGLHGIASKII